MKKIILQSFFLSLSIICLTGIWLSGLISCENKKEIKIGFSGSLTGKFADLGIDGRDAVILAIDERNRAGGINGRKLTLSVKDDKHDPETAVRVDRELIREGVAAIIGHMTSAMTITALPLINREKVLMISPTASTPKLTGMDDFLFRVINSSRHEADQLAAYCFDKMKLTRMGCLYDLSNRSFSENWYLRFKSTFTRLGGEISHSQGFSSSRENSHLHLVRSVINSNTEGLIIAAGAVDTAMICQAVRKSGSEIPIFSSGWALTSELIRYGGATTEGVVFVQSFNKTSRNPEFLRFKENFTRRFDRVPGFAAVLSYDAAQVLFYALSHSRTPEELKETIVSKCRFNGLQDGFKIDRYGDAQKKLYVTTVMNGQFTVIQ